MMIRQETKAMLIWDDFDVEDGDDKYCCSPLARTGHSSEQTRNGAEK